MTVLIAPSMKLNGLHARREFCLELRRLSVLLLSTVDHLRFTSCEAHQILLANAG